MLMYTNEVEPIIWLFRTFGDNWIEAQQISEIGY